MGKRTDSACCHLFEWLRIASLRVSQKVLNERDAPLKNGRSAGGWLLQEVNEGLSQFGRGKLPVERHDIKAHLAPVDSGLNIYLADRRDPDDGVEHVGAPFADSDAKEDPVAHRRLGKHLHRGVRM